MSKTYEFDNDQVTTLRKKIFDLQQEEKNINNLENQYNQLKKNCSILENQINNLNYINN